MHGYDAYKVLHLNCEVHGLWVGEDDSGVQSLGRDQYATHWETEIERVNISSVLP